MKKIIPGTIFIVLLFFAFGGTAWASENRALILIDEQVADPGPSYESNLENLLGHFDLPYDVKLVDSYSSGDFDRYRVTFYLGTAWDKPLPDEFLSDAVTTDSRLVWINYNLWRLDWSDYREAFEAKHGFSFTQVASTGAFNKVLFNGRNYTRSQDDYAQTVIQDQARARTIGEITNGTKKYPYIIQSGNFYFVPDDPTSQVAEDSDYLVFCEALHDMVGVQHSTSHKALVRIEDVDATEDPADIRAIADYLSGENVPFSLAVIPRFADPLGVWGPPGVTDINQKPDLVSALQYAVSKGGTVVMHGFTHQYDSVANPTNGVSGVDSEFYIETTDAGGNIIDVGPVPEDSASWVQERIDAGQAILSNAGLPRPAIWETPHYLASELDHQVFAGNFGITYERFTNSYFPYVINRTVYGSRLIPENLGYLEPGVLTPQMLINRADKELGIRDGYASFFYHSEVGISLLETTVTGIKAKGYTFVDVKSLAATDDNPPWVSSVSPSGSIGEAPATVSAAFSDFGSGINPASAQLMLDGAALGSCDARGNAISCPLGSIAIGTHTIRGAVSDNAGNSSPISGSFTVFDEVSPAITNLKPTGTIFTDSTTISADFSDSGSGIDPISQQATLDGSPLTGCIWGGSSVSCPVSGLGLGTHEVSIFMSDLEGNQARLDGSFDIESCETAPDLVLSVTASYWSSYSNYVQRILSVNYLLSNSESYPVGFEIKDVVCSNGATLESMLPGALQTPGTSGTPMTLTFLVPPQVTSFRSTIYAAVQNPCGAYFYLPAPNPGV